MRIKNKDGKNSRLLFIDTGNLINEIKTEDNFKDHSMDFSNYLVRLKYDGSNKLVVGKMKDETGEITIEEFLVLQTKMYSFLLDNSSEQKTKLCE